MFKEIPESLFLLYKLVFVIWCLFIVPGSIFVCVHLVCTGLDIANRLNVLHWWQPGVTPKTSIVTVCVYVCVCEWDTRRSIVMCLLTWCIIHGVATLAFPADNEQAMQRCWAQHSTALFSWMTHTHKHTQQTQREREKCACVCWHLKRIERKRVQKYFTGKEVSYLKSDTIWFKEKKNCFFSVFSDGLKNSLGGVAASAITQLPTETRNVHEL